MPLNTIIFLSFLQPSLTIFLNSVDSPECDYSHYLLTSATTISMGRGQKGSIQFVLSHKVYTDGTFNTTFSWLGYIAHVDIFFICVALVHEQKYLSHTKNELWHHRFGRLRSHQIQCSKFPPQGVPFINNGTPCDPSAMVVDISNADFCHILARLNFLVTAVHVMLWMPVMLLCCTVVTQPCLLSSQHQIWYELHPKPLSRKLLRSTQNWMAFWHFKRIKKEKKTEGFSWRNMFPLCYWLPGRV